jgi:hypothetical protein
MRLGWIEKFTLVSPIVSVLNTPSLPLLGDRLDCFQSKKIHHCNKIMLGLLLTETTEWGLLNPLEHIWLCSEWRHFKCSHERV